MYQSTRLKRKIQPKSKEDNLRYDILCITKNIENDLNEILKDQRRLINHLETEIEQ